MTSLYLINPRPEVADYDTAAGFNVVPDLAIVTVAAMAPANWHVQVCEEYTSKVDFDTQARFVGLTGKTAQLKRMLELAAAFRERGKIVLVGGPMASLDPEAVRAHADILVTGEIEEIAPQLFADLEAGTWKDAYQGGRADIRLSPLPRWDLYPVDRALMGALQTTRGCPFDCEFCDVIAYNGRKQRHKDVAQVLRELDALHAAGFRQVFLTDDNFTVHRAFARTILDAFAGWNAAHADDPIRFVTQASIDLARDEDLMNRCVEAGLTHLFVGIETVNTASLREINKKQNLLMPALNAVERIVSSGLLVRCGIIVGFDHDGPDIFDTLFDFLQSAPLPMPGINVLNASKATPLHARMVREGRLLDNSKWTGGFSCNFVPKLMTREELFFGTWKLARRLFAPDAFEHRMMSLIRQLGGSEEAVAARRTAAGARSGYAIGCIRKVSALGVQEAEMVSRILAAAAAKPATLRHVITCLVFYAQYRAYLDNVGGRRQVAA